MIFFKPVWILYLKLKKEIRHPNDNLEDKKDPKVFKSKNRKIWGEMKPKFKNMQLDS